MQLHIHADNWLMLVKMTDLQFNKVPTTSERQLFEILASWILAQERYTKNKSSYMNLIYVTICRLFCIAIIFSLIRFSPYCLKHISICQISLNSLVKNECEYVDVVCSTQNMMAKPKIQRMMQLSNFRME